MSSADQAAKKVVKNLMFYFRPKFGGRRPLFFGGGAFVNRHQFRLTGQVLVEIPWLVFHLC